MEQLNDLKLYITEIQITREKVKSFLLAIRPTRHNLGWWLLAGFLGFCGIGFIYVFLTQLGFNIYLFGDNRATFFDPILVIINIIFDSIINPILAFFRVPTSTPFKATGEIIEIRGLRIVRGLANASIVTLQLSAISLAVGFVIAISLAVILVRPGKVWGLKWFAQIYVDFFRSTPLLVQLLLIYFGIPQLFRIFGIIFFFREVPAAIIGLALNTAAYQAEIIRAGILAIPVGQSEAARGLGMTTGQTMRYVILPQALRIIIPPYTNEGINLILNSSLALLLSVFELTLTAKNLAGEFFIPFQTYLLAAIFYFVMTYSLAKLTLRFEKEYRIPGLGIQHD